ncbi:MAG: type I-B CRISPR-associated endonuclease Cas1 [Saprospiraceae bacterium]|nr:type I-B CRISPR-associated endonuclease Cas1 [Saprospiraceae bacterium]
MKRTYYLFNDGRMSRKDNTLCFVARDNDGNDLPAKYIPIETIEALYVFGALDVNAAMLNFLGQQHISMHFFDYYEHYTGSFMPKDYLLAGKMQIEQTKAYLNKKKRLHIAGRLVDGAAHNIIKNLRYYDNRDRDLTTLISQIEQHSTSLADSTDIGTIMGIEGNIRLLYYQAWESILPGWQMSERTRQPPSNEVNALISFGNTLCYTLALSSLYHTQLNPTVSFLHEPGYRRYSLALDIAEVFKPILVDRTIFRVLNKKEIQSRDFDHRLNGCYLSQNGRKTFLRAWEERLGETIKHRTLQKQVSYKHLVRLECYKIAKFILGDAENYEPFKIWW